MFSQEKQIKAVILDSTQANKVITIIENGKTAQLKLDKAYKRISDRDKYITKLEDNKCLNEKALLLSEHGGAVKDTIISNDVKIQRKQSRKITFWQVVSGLLTSLLIFQSVR